MIDRNTVEFEIASAREARIGAELACRDIAELADEIRRSRPALPWLAAALGTASGNAAKITASDSSEIHSDSAGRSAARVAVIFARAPASRASIGHVGTSPAAPAQGIFAMRAIDPVARE